MNFYKVSWEELENDCHLLVNKIGNRKFDRILCISRGGLVWARMLSDLLDLPVSHLTAVSYTGIHEQKDVKITELPNHENIKNQKLLIVDEIADHGKTFEAIRKHLKELKINNYYTLAPIIRSYTKPRPDLYLKIIDDWIIYPYEIKETYKAFVKIFKSEKTARLMLTKYGFSDRLLKNL